MTDNQVESNVAQVETGNLNPCLQKTNSPSLELQTSVKSSKRRSRFVHTFGYHRKPRPATIPKKIKVSSKNRVLACVEQVEFAHTSHFMPNADENWLDSNDDLVPLFQLSITPLRVFY